MKLKKEIASRMAGMLGNGMVNSDGPNWRRTPIQTGYQGGMTDSADNYFGGNAGIGQLVPDIEEEEVDEEEDEKLLKSLKVMIKEVKEMDKTVSKYLEEEKIDEELEEMNAGGVAGAMVPIDREADGTKTTKSKLKKKRKYFQNIWK